MIVFRTASLAAVMMLACAHVHAAEPARDALVAEFTQALGMESLIDSSRDQARQVTVAQKDVLVDNLRQAGLSQEAMDEIAASFDEIMQKVMNSWSTKEASRIYAGAIANSMSDEDLKKCIVFYKSGEGQRSLTAAGSAAAKLQEYVQKSITDAMVPALKEFTAKSQAIAAADRQKHAPSGK